MSNLKALKNEILINAPSGKLQTLKSALNTLKTVEEVENYKKYLIDHYHSDEWRSWFHEELDKLDSLKDLFAWEKKKFVEYQQKYPVEKYPKTKPFTTLIQYLTFENELENSNTSSENTNICNIVPGKNNWQLKAKKKQVCRGGKRKTRRGKKSRRMTRRH